MNDRINGVKAGTGIRASWGNDIVDQLRRLHLIPGNGIKISTSSKGTVISLDKVEETSGSNVNAISDVIPCVVESSSDEGGYHGYSVTLYANGFGEAQTGTGTLYIPELATHTKLPNKTSILAHVCLTTYTESDEDGDDTTPPAQGGE